MHKIRYLGVIDQEDQQPMKLALFGNDAETPPNIDDSVTISHVYKYTMKKRLADGSLKPIANGADWQSAAGETGIIYGCSS